MDKVEQKHDEIEREILDATEVTDQPDYCEHGKLLCEDCDSPCAFGQHEPNVDGYGYCDLCGKEL